MIYMKQFIKIAKTIAKLKTRKPVDPFPANVPILYPLKTTEDHLVFSPEKPSGGSR